MTTSAAPLQSKAPGQGKTHIKFMEMTKVGLQSHIVVHLSDDTIWLKRVLPDGPQRWELISDIPGLDPRSTVQDVGPLVEYDLFDQIVGAKGTWEDMVTLCRGRGFYVDEIMEQAAQIRTAQNGHHLGFIRYEMENESQNPPCRITK